MTSSSGVVGAAEAIRRIHFWERCEPPRQIGACTSLFMRRWNWSAPEGGAGFEILHNRAGFGAGYRRGPGGQTFRDYCRIFRSDKVRRSRAKGSKMMKGRPIAREEFERMLDAIP